MDENVRNLKANNNSRYENFLNGAVPVTVDETLEKFEQQKKYVQSENKGLDLSIVSKFRF